MGSEHVGRIARSALRQTQVLLALWLPLAVSVPLQVGLFEAPSGECEVSVGDPGDGDETTACFESSPQPHRFVALLHVVDRSAPRAERRLTARAPRAPPSA